MSSGAAKRFAGSVTGTGASLTIRGAPFKPRSVRLVNQGGLVTGEWFDPMPEGSVAKRVTAGTMTVPTTNGVTPTSDGFTLGADADLNVDGELIYYEMFE